MLYNSRFEKNRNKNFEELYDKKTVLSYSLYCFNLNQYIGNTILAIKQEELKIIEEIVKNEKISKPIQFIYGGSSRKESVYNCLKNCDSDIVIIHDSARPLIMWRLLKYKGHNHRRYQLDKKFLRR